MKTLYILRHGKTIWNKERKAQGRTDVPLSDEGRKEAYKVKEYIESLNIDGIYSSPLKRALETAEIVSQDISYKIFKTDDDLIERSFGHYEGELVEKLPFSILTKENPEFDGEGVDESADRFKKCLLDIVSNSECERILIVTHGGILYNFLKEYEHFDINDSELSHNPLKNCSITTITYDGKFNIKEIGYLPYKKD